MGGFLAILLASVGVYGVVSYAVSQSYGEIGLRMVLGAQGTEVIGLMVRRSCSPGLVGVGVGLVMTLALTRVTESLLVGVRPNDPLTLLVASFLMLGVVILATYVPARRAAGVDPGEALQAE